MARIWALVLLLVSTSADAAFYFVREGQIVRLGPEISYLVEDPKSPRTFEDVSRASAGWISQKDKPYAAADGPASIWMRFDVPADIGAKPVFVNVPLWEHEEFFIVRDGALVDRERAGGALKRSERTVRVTMIPVASSGFAPLEVKPGARTTVYAHLETSNRYYSADLLLARLWDADRVLEGERRDRLVQGIFYGVLFFLISYNLALFLVVRESAFLYYVLMELGFATTWTAVTGVSVEYLTPNHPGWDFYYVWIGGAIGGFGGWQFVREFLDTRKHFPRMDRALALMAYANFFVIPLVFLIPAETLQTALFAAVPFGAIALIATVAIAFKQRGAAAFNLLVAMSCLGLGFIIFVGAAQGTLPQNNWTMHAGQIGSVLVGIVLSIGLGFRLQGERTRLARLNRFLSPKVSELIAAGKLDDPLATRRREVTIVFVDLRGFTAFSDTAEPEDVMGVLREYHAEIGRLVGKYEATIEHFAGDGVMIIFNDPAPLPDPAFAAVSMAVELRDNVARLSETWRKLGHKLACGLGIAQGYATIGTIGFEGRQDYGVIGAVNNLAARLCAQAGAGQVLVSQRVYARVEGRVVAEHVGDLALKGIHEPVPAYNIVALKPASARASEAVAATQYAD